MNLAISNPKRKSDKLTGNASWYSFYPGFSNEFAIDLLRSARLRHNSCICDPWNGSGATTSAAAALGYRAIGCDLNPAMIVTARARLLSAGEKPSLRPIASEILKTEINKCRLQCDPLSDWFVPDAAERVRQIETGIQRLLVPGEYASWSQRNLKTDLSEIAAFFYVVLFRTVRQLIKSRLGTNPTWTRRLSNDSLLSPSPLEIDTMFISNLRFMIKSVSDQSEHYTRQNDHLRIYLSSSEALEVDDDSVDFILTSPPYCTRIDYAVATLPELSILGYGIESGIDNLRRALIGTSTVPKVAPIRSADWGVTCNSFLNAVENHESKASKTYYLKSHLQYFNSIYNSLSHIHRVLRPKATCVIVAQDSHYKDVHNDLPRILCEMGATLGLSVYRREDFVQRQTMAGINPKVRRYRSTAEATESVLCLVKSKP